MCTYLFHWPSLDNGPDCITSIEFNCVLALAGLLHLPIICIFHSLFPRNVLILLIGSFEKSEGLFLTKMIWKMSLGFFVTLFVEWVRASGNKVFQIKLC